LGFRAEPGCVGARRLQFFPCKTAAVRYTLSVWAKAEPLTAAPLRLRLGVGTIGGENVRQSCFLRSP